MMEFRTLSFLYNPGTPEEVKALDNISLTIGAHEFVGLLGHTGSGKSTLVQHMNGLNLPSLGKVIINGLDTQGPKENLKRIRQEVGLVFQYPEDQLFEETIYKDIAFGPKNLGLSKEEIDRRVRTAMADVGLDFEQMAELSPFEISGGQKRRVAIAGVLALEPHYLVLDEPTAGLDPRGRDEILGRLLEIYQSRASMTIILVTHSMEDVATYANRILVMDRGRLVGDGTPKEIFAREQELEAIGLSVPQVTHLMGLLRKKGLDVTDCALTVEEAFQSLERVLSPKQAAEGAQGAMSLSGYEEEGRLAHE